MIVKYIGGAILVAAGWLLGNSLYAVYTDRVKLLERFKEFITYCESEISYSKTEWNEIVQSFRQTGSPLDSILFDETPSFSINTEIRNLIRSFSGKIAALDYESQKKYFFDMKTKLTALTEKSEKEVALRGKMFKRVVPICAIGIFILMV